MKDSWPLCRRFPEVWLAGLGSQPSTSLVKESSLLYVVLGEVQGFPGSSPQCLLLPLPWGSHAWPWGSHAWPTGPLGKGAHSPHPLIPLLLLLHIHSQLFSLQPPLVLPHIEPSWFRYWDDTGNPLLPGSFPRSNKCNLHLWPHQPEHELTFCHWYKGLEVLPTRVPV